MTPNELSEKLTTEYNERLAALLLLPECVEIGHVLDSDIHFAHDLHATNMESLRQIRKAWGMYRLDIYYECVGCLCLVYKFANSPWGVLFYSTDAENALESVSGGKCKIVDETITKTERKVVCGVEGGE